MRDKLLISSNFLRPMYQSFYAFQEYYPYKESKNTLKILFLNAQSKKKNDEIPLKQNRTTFESLASKEISNVHQ